MNLQSFKTDLNFNNTYYNQTGSVIEPKGLGSVSKNIVTKNLFANVSTTYLIENIELIDSSNFTYKLNLFDDHNFIGGDNALINLSLIHI